MRDRWQQPQLSGCVSGDELATLFDQAFAQWRPGSGDEQGRRETPRVAPPAPKRLYLVSCAHAGRQIPLERPAAIVDISADGLGVVLNQPLPAGAIVCFAYGDGVAGRGYGFAFVAQSTRYLNAHRVGLAFAEKAAAIDIHDEDEGGPVGPGNAARDAQRHEAKNQRPAAPDESQRADGGDWRAVCRRLDRLRRAVVRTALALITRRAARRRLALKLYGKEAELVVTVTLLCYTAALWVDGLRVSVASGALRGRFEGLLGRGPGPTMLHLEGAGFTAWAALKPNAVFDAGLDIQPGLKRQIVPRVRQVGTGSAFEVPTSATERQQA